MPKRKSILQRGSVGRGGVNWWLDIDLVVMQLNLHLVGHGKSPVIRTTPDNVSGQIDAEIVRAIKWFQAKVVQLPPKWQDGRVDPKGWTLESLLSPAKAPIRYRGIEKSFEEFDVQEWWDSHKWKPLERSTWIPKAAKDWARIAPKANVIVKVFKGSDSNWGDIYVWKSKNPKLKCVLKTNGYVQFFQKFPNSKAYYKRIFKRHGIGDLGAETLRLYFDAWNKYMHYHVYRNGVCPANAVYKTRKALGKEAVMTYELVNNMPGGLGRIPAVRGLSTGQRATPMRPVASATARSPYRPGKMGYIEHIVDDLAENPEWKNIPKWVDTVKKAFVGDEKEFD